MKNIFISILFLIVCLTVTFGQSEYLEKGVSGFGINADFNSSQDAIGIGGGMGYSLSGRFDIGLSVNRFGLKKEEFLNTDLSSIVLMPHITLHALKQRESMPISFSMMAGYEHANYFSSALDDYNIKMIGNHFSIGGSFFRFFNVNKIFKIQPSIEAYYTFRRLTTKYADFKKYEDTEAIAYGLGVSLVFDISQKSIFVITPELGISEDVIIFGMSLRFIFVDLNSFIHKYLS